MNSLPDPDEFEWTFEKHGSVGVWNLEGWQGWADEELESITTHYRERGEQNDIKSTIAVFGDQAKLGAETQEYMADQWSENGRYVDADRIAFVSNGVTAMAVLSNLDVPAETKSFNDLPEAIEWCKDV